MKNAFFTLAALSLLGLGVACNRGGGDQSTQGQDAGRMEQQTPGAGTGTGMDMDTPAATDSTMPADTGMQQEHNPSDASRLDE